MPSIADAEGIGTERQYDFKDLVALRVAIELRQAGISTQALRRVVNRLRTSKGLRNPLAELHLVVIGSDVHLVLGRNDVMSLITKPGQSIFAFMVDIGRTVQEVDRDVKALRAA